MAGSLDFCLSSLPFASPLHSIHLLSTLHHTISSHSAYFQSLHFRSRIASHLYKHSKALATLNMSTHPVNTPANLHRVKLVKNEKYVRNGKMAYGHMLRKCTYLLTLALNVY